jgi:hypothetical protein
MPIISVTPEAEAGGSQANPGYIVRPCLKGEEKKMSYYFK